MKQILFILTLFLLFSCSEKKKNEVITDKKNYEFEGSISREVLENYLERSFTFSEFLTISKYCNDGTYLDKDKDIELVKSTGAKFIGRAIYRWGSEQVLNEPDFWKGAKEIMDKVHANDPDVIFQAAVFESIYKDGVNSIKIPAWTFESLGLPVEDRNFSYSSMLNDQGKFINLWGQDGSVPDITKVETQLWFMYLIGSYVELGVEAIHLGQVELIGMNDPGLKVWNSFMQKVRKNVNQMARRKFVLFDAHTPSGGMVIDGVSLLDFNSFPLRIKEVEAEPMKGILEVGYIDSMFGRSKGCKTPSGWTCESLPYLVELDNFGISETPGKSTIDKHLIWGYDEISWFFLQTKEYQAEWLNYAYNWLKENDKNGFLQMPGARVVSVEEGKEPPSGTFRAIAPTQDTPHGADLEDVIKKIWSQH